MINEYVNDKIAYGKPMFSEVCGTGAYHRDGGYNNSFTAALLASLCFTWDNRDAVCQQAF